MELNNRIFQTLSEVAGSIDPTLTADHVRAMGLDPQGDRSFLVDLLEVYGFDVTLVIDNPCCPWVSPFMLWGTQNSISTGYLCLLAPHPTPHIQTLTLSTEDTASSLGPPPLTCYCLWATSNPRTFTEHWRVDAKDTFCSRGDGLSRSLTVALGSGVLLQLFTSQIILQLMSCLFVSLCLTLLMKSWLMHWINIWISWHVVDKSSFSSSAPFAMKTDLSLNFWDGDDLFP